MNSGVVSMLIGFALVGLSIYPRAPAAIYWIGAALILGGAGAIIIFSWVEAVGAGVM